MTAAPTGPARGGGHPLRRRPLAWLWLAAGALAVAVGGIGVVVPGLPTTVFFVIAAACFARCSPRLERWVLDLPRIGPLVRDHRAGLGMPRRAKAVAVTMILVAVTISAVFGIDNLGLGAAVVALGLVGASYVVFRVPTRERVLAQRSAPDPVSGRPPGESLAAHGRTAVERGKRRGRDLNPRTR